LEELQLVLEEFHWIFFKNEKDGTFAMKYSEFLVNHTLAIQDGQSFAPVRCHKYLASMDSIPLVKFYIKLGFKLDKEELLKYAKIYRSKTLAVDYLGSSLLLNEANLNGNFLK
jgi:hypothetical protein